MDVEEGCENLVVKILMELCDQVFEHSGGNVCNENNGKKIIDEMEVTKCVGEVLCNMVDTCSQGFILNQEPRRNTGDSQTEITSNNCIDECRDVDQCFEEVTYHSARSGQLKKETKNCLNICHISEVGGNDGPINYHSGTGDYSEMDIDTKDSADSKQWNPSTSPRGKVEIFRQEKVFVEDRFTFKEDDNLLENKYILHQDNEELLTVKETRVEEQGLVQQVVNEDTGFGDQTDLPNLEYNIQSCEDSEPEKMDQTNITFEIQDMIQHQTYSDEEKGVQNNITTKEKLYRQEYGIDDQTRLPGLISTELSVLQEQQTSSFNNIREDNMMVENQGMMSQPSQQDVNVVNDNTFQEEVHSHVFNSSVEQCHLFQIEERQINQFVEQGHISHQDELEDQAFEQFNVHDQKIEQPIEQDFASQEKVVQDQLCELYVLQDQHSQETVQDEEYEQSIDKGKGMTCKEKVKDDTFKQCIEEKNVSQENIVLGLMSEKSVQQDRTFITCQPQDHKTEEADIPETALYQTSEHPFQQEQSSEQNEAQDQATVESIEQDQTFEQNEAHDQATAEFIEQNKTSEYNEVQDQATVEFIEQAQTLEQNEAQDQATVESIEQDQTSEQNEAQDQATVEQDQTSEQNKVQDQVTIESIEQDQTSEQNEAHDQATAEFIEQNKTSEYNEVQDQATVEFIEQTQTLEQNEAHDQATAEFIEQNKTSEQNEAQDQATIESIEQAQTLEQNEAQDQATVEFIKQNKTSEQNEAQDQATVEFIKQNKTSEYNEAQDQATVEFIEQDQTSEKNEAQDQVTVESLKQDHASEHLIAQDKDKTILGCQQNLKYQQGFEQNLTTVVQVHPSEQSIKNDQFSQKPSVHEQTSSESKEQYVEQNCTCQCEIFVENFNMPNQNSKKNVAQNLTCEQSLDEKRTFDESAVKNQIWENMILESRVQDHTINTQEQTCEKNVIIKDRFVENTFVQDQIALQPVDSIVQEQISEVTAMQVEKENYMHENQASECFVQEQSTQEGVPPGNPLQLKNLQDSDEGETRFEEENIQCEKIEDNYAKDTELKNFKHLHRSEKQTHQDHMAVKQINFLRTVAGECEKDLTDYKIEGTKGFTSHEHWKDQTFEQSPILANQSLNSQCKLDQNYSEENPSCRHKRSFLATEETKSIEEEPDLKRICINMKCTARIDDQAVPSVEAAGHFLPQEETGIYSSCSEGSKQWKENSPTAYEVCTKGSVLEHVNTDKQVIQNALPDDEMPIREGGAFKWKYVPSFDTDAVVPKKDETDGCEQLIRVTPLPICRKPRRLGLSKKQKIQHLHPNVKRPH
ncbi:uncharacterized protein LOC117326283 [Pecten maximus]|uniref:uncharacterized protein LOC117326283 n=1 Tax=Pecten maximus TaxID=6579 RepID=UPI00145869A0|nr:uncharacterized protein LOC117326283 [Pecten maximus]